MSNVVEIILQMGTYYTLIFLLLGAKMDREECFCALVATGLFGVFRVCYLLRNNKKRLRL